MIRFLPMAFFLYLKN
ncbi:hypothetical protein Patl1_28105 [Pistacia atlantica]|uniref:Uncharacterized protein n=1 Tax=Pistacia atlantica TaxID=434234 RepID=A0ACC1BFH1_9ROSI|nr:hypothetical protein Patl1_28105 [Pistacia atlantica]